MLPIYLLLSFFVIGIIGVLIFYYFVEIKPRIEKKKMASKWLVNDSGNTIIKIEKYLGDREGWFVYEIKESIYGKISIKETEMKYIFQFKYTLNEDIRIRLEHEVEKYKLIKKAELELEEYNLNKQRNDSINSIVENLSANLDNTLAKQMGITKKIPKETPKETVVVKKQEENNRLETIS